MKTIDWDNYEVLEAEDYTDEELYNTIEELRETMDDYLALAGELPENLEELMQTLGRIEEEITND